MRSATIWIASVALLGAPILITANAAPAPGQPKNLHRRYRVPIRRQVSLPFNNGSPPSSISSLPVISTVDPIIPVSDSPAASSQPAAIIPVSISVPDAVPAPSTTPLQNADSQPSQPPQESGSGSGSGSLGDQAPLSISDPTPSQPTSAGLDPNLIPPSIVPSVALPTSLVPNVIPSVDPSNLISIPSSTPAPAADQPVDPSNPISSISPPTQSQSPSDPDGLGITLPSVLPVVSSLLGSLPTGSVPDVIIPASSSAPTPTDGDAGILPALLPSSPATSQIIVGLNTVISGIISDLNPGPTASPGADPNQNNNPLSLIPSLLPDVIATATGDAGAILPSIISSLVPVLGNGGDGSTTTTDGVLPPLSLLPSLLPSNPLSGGLIPPPDVTTTDDSGMLPTAPVSGVLPPISTGMAGGGLSGIPGILPTDTNTLTGTAPTGTDGSQMPVPALATPASVTPNPLVTEAPLVSATDKITDQFTVSATGSDSLSGMPSQSVIVVAPADAPKATVAPSSMPKVIQPPSGRPVKTANTTLVQFGFTEPLNYAFVSTNEDAINQIFQFMPLAVQGVLNNLDVNMQSIQPYDTSKSLQYVTTMAMLYVPTDSISQLTVSLHTPNSALFNNDDPRVTTLMSFLNPGIPILAGQPMTETTGTSGSQASSSPGQVNGADPFGSDAQISSPVSTSSATMVAPVAAGALVYGVAMIIISRRYMERRRRHKRASSVSGEPAWMSGTRSGSGSGSGNRVSQGSGNTSGRSVRTAQISAPVMSANSLGWN